MRTARKKETKRQEYEKLDRAFRMLYYATELDRFEIDELDQKVKNHSEKLTLLEKKYRISNYNESRNIQRYPITERANVIKLWNSIEEISDDLDYLFIDEDLYAC